MSKEDQNYEREKYWSFTAAKTDINSVSDNLKIIIDAIDKKKSYSEIQDEITIFNKFSKESARKMINQCVKLGFIEPGINDSERNKYHPNCKKFIEEKDKTTKRIYFSNIFLEHNKLKSSFDENNDYGKVNKIKFLLNTIDQIGKLNEDQQYALMLCNPDDNRYKNGFISKNQLQKIIEDMKAKVAYKTMSKNKFVHESKIKFSNLTFIDQEGNKLEKSNDFERFKVDKKNQKQHLFCFVKLTNFVVDYKGTLYTEEEREILEKNEPRTKTSKSSSRPEGKAYRNELIIESLKLIQNVDFDFGDKAVCMSSNLDMKQAKLVASHIWPYSVCSEKSKGDKDNGLLLGENRDYFFDNGRISYSNEGLIIYKKLDGKIEISENWRHVLENEKINQVLLTDRRKKYLTIHRMDNSFQDKEEKLYNSLCEELSK